MLTLDEGQAAMADLAKLEVQVIELNAHLAESAFLWAHRLQLMAHVEDATLEGVEEFCQRLQPIWMRTLIVDSGVSPSSMHEQLFTS